MKIYRRELLGKHMLYSMSGECRMGDGSLSLPPCTTSATCTVFIVLEPVTLSGKFKRSGSGEQYDGNLQ